MKLLTIILPLLLLGSEIIVAQTTDSIIKDIRAKYKNIRDNFSTYDTTTAEILGESTEGGQAVAFYDGDAIKLIKVTWFGEMGKRKTEYYFDNGQLFFAFDAVYEYNRPIYWDEKVAKEYGDSEVFDDSKTKIIENRYYFNDGQLIRWLDKDKEEVDIKTDASSSMGNELIEHSEKMKEKLKK
jgi:hypothetical protein